MKYLRIKEANEVIAKLETELAIAKSRLSALEDRQSSTPKTKDKATNVDAPSMLQNKGMKHIIIQ